MRMALPNRGASRLTSCKTEREWGKREERREWEEDGMEYGVSLYELVLDQVQEGREGGKERGREGERGGWGCSVVEE